MSTGNDRPISYWTVEELKRHANEVTLIDPEQQTLENLQRAGHNTSEHFDGTLDVVTVQ